MLAPFPETETETETETEDIRSGIAGRTPEELAEAEAMARRLKGEFRYVKGFGYNNIMSSGLLPVVGPTFTLDDLTPRAICRLLISRYRRVFQLQ